MALLDKQLGERPDNDEFGLFNGTQWSNQAYEARCAEGEGFEGFEDGDLAPGVSDDIRDGVTGVFRGHVSDPMLTRLVELAEEAPGLTPQEWEDSERKMFGS